MEGVSCLYQGGDLSSGDGGGGWLASRGVGELSWGRVVLIPLPHLSKPDSCPSLWHTPQVFALWELFFLCPVFQQLKHWTSYVTDSWSWWYKRHFNPVHCTHGKNVFVGNGLVYTNLFPLKTVVLRLVTGFWMR